MGQYCLNLNPNIGYMRVICQKRRQCLGKRSHFLWQFLERFCAYLGPQKNLRRRYPKCFRLRLPTKFVPNIVFRRSLLTIV